MRKFIALFCVAALVGVAIAQEECQTEGDCDGENCMCVERKCQCFSLVECTNDAGCTGGKHCNDHHMCVECTENAHCTNGICLSEACSSAKGSCEDGESTGSCQLCDEEDGNKCINCAYSVRNPVYLYKGKCYDGCPDGFEEHDGVCLTALCTEDSVTGDVIAKEGTNCKTCSPENGECTACIDGYRLNDYDCEPCEASHCTTCNADPNQCDSCVDGYTLVDLGEGSNCIKTPCTNQLCDTCRSNGECITCVSGYYVNADFGCTANTCESPCATCTGTATECLSCVPGYSYNGDDEHTCTANQCESPCATCTETATECLSCVPGYSYNGDDEHTCTADTCPQGCVCEEGSDTCSSCVGGYYNAASEGVDCQKCDDICATCSGSASACITCATGYHMAEGKCVVDTPAGSDSDSTSDTPTPGVDSSSSKHIEPPKSSEAPSGLGVGAVVGIVIGALIVAAVIIVAVYCAATAGAKRGKIDPVIYEEDTEFVTMSVL